MRAALHVVFLGQSSPVFCPFLRQPDHKQLQIFQILLRPQLKLIATSCMIGCNWLQTYKSQELVCKSRTLGLYISITSLFCMKQQVFGLPLSILGTYIENPCFVHFKHPLDMCKSRDCKLISHQP